MDPKWLINANWLSDCDPCTNNHLLFSTSQTRLFMRFNFLPTSLLTGAALLRATTPTELLNVD